MGYSKKYGFHFTDRNDYNKKVNKFRKPRIQNTEKDREYHKKWRAENKDKIRAKNDRWKAKHPDYSPYDGMSEEEEKKYRKDKWLKSTYGISLEFYNQTLEKQGNKCASCGENFKDSYHTHVDHDHSYGKKDPNGFLALLCSGCNKARGMLRNSTDVIRGLLQYQEWIDRRNL